MKRYRPKTLDELTFTRERMVGWFDPPQLAQTGLNVFLSSIFGSFADKREMQAALDPNPRPITGAADGTAYDFSPDGTFWLDYVADLGDGFDATYTVAHQLARPMLDVANAGPLRRGNVLVMGGDQVYPRATREEYRNRLYGPYEAALPCDFSGAHPHLYALPGNHDWYDGLTSFIRLFCQGRWIGGWETHQSRSYFGVKLPGPWWLWGVDFQLESDIDEPQLNYFRHVIAPSVKPEHRIILCVPEPVWVQTWLKRQDAYDRLAFFEKQVIAPTGASVPLVLTGDLHHYARYAAPNKHLITCGGGGAYLYPTHHLPDELRFGEKDPLTGAVEELAYERKAIFPDAETSKRQVRKVGTFFFRRKDESSETYRQNKGFARLLAAIYALFAWLLLTARAAPATNDSMSFVNLLSTLVHSPASVILTALVIAGLAVFAKPERQGDGAPIVADPPPPPNKISTTAAKFVGGVHGTLHVLLAIALTWFFPLFNDAVIPAGSYELLRQSGRLGLFLVEMYFIGGALGGLLMGAYLYLANVWFGLHDNEVFSVQAIRDNKSFLRLRFDASGLLTVYPIGIDEANHRWKANPDGPDGDSLIIPETGVRIDAHLIERPIVIDGGGGPPVSGVSTPRGARAPR